MKILVSSRDRVCGLVEKIQKDKPDSKVVVISITDPKSDIVNLPLDESDILRLSFHDLDQTYPFSGRAIILFDQDMAQKIGDFFQQKITTYIDSISFYEKNLILICHCEAGISRSAGVAGALSKHFNDDDSMFFKTPYYPNRFVYKILLDFLNGKNNLVPNVVIDRNDNNIF